MWNNFGLKEIKPTLLLKCCLRGTAGLHFKRLKQMKPTYRGRIVGVIPFSAFNHHSAYVLHRGRVCSITSTSFTVCETEAKDATVPEEPVWGQLIRKTQSKFVGSLTCGWSLKGISLTRLLDGINLSFFAWVGSTPSLWLGLFLNDNVLIMFTRMRS